MLAFFGHLSRGHFCVVCLFPGYSTGPQGLCSIYPPQNHIKTRRESLGKQLEGDSPRAIV